MYLSPNGKGVVDMETVMVFLTSIINLIAAGINLSIMIKNGQGNKKRPRSAKRKS